MQRDLSLADIRFDGGTQPREKIDAETVKEYAARMLDGDTFPPIVVFFDGENHWLVDGFHRILAAREAGLTDFSCIVIEGTLDDARWYSYRTNATHGLPRSNEDKARAVTAALKHAHAVGLSNRAIAKHVGVDHKTVSRYRKQLESGGEIPHLDERIGGDGKQYPASRWAPRSRRPFHEIPEASRHETCKLCWDLFASHVLLYDAIGWSREELVALTGQPRSAVEAVFEPVPPLRFDIKANGRRLPADLRDAYRQDAESLVNFILWTAYGKAASAAESGGFHEVAPKLEARAKHFEELSDYQREWLWDCPPHGWSVEDRIALSCCADRDARFALQIEPDSGEDLTPLFNQHRTAVRAAVEAVVRDQDVVLAPDADLAGDGRSAARLVKALAMHYLRIWPA